MPVEISPEFRSLSSKIYTFSVLSFGLKYLEIDLAGAFNTTVVVSNEQALVGALGLLTCALCVAAAFVAIRDYVFTMVADSTVFESSDGSASPMLENSFAARNFRLVTIVSRVGVTIEILAPILFGAILSFSESQDMIYFIQKVIS